MLGLHGGRMSQIYIVSMVTEVKAKLSNLESLKLQSKIALCNFSM
jgi:hypothetical protein